MDYEQVGNNASSTASNTQAELAELDREFSALAEDFDLDQGSGNDSTTELDALIAGTELEPTGAESSGGISILDIADKAGSGTESDAEFFSVIGNFIKKKASRLIRKLISIVRRAPKYAVCVPKVMADVAAFKLKKWGTALRLAYAAYKCIKSKS